MTPDEFRRLGHTLVEWVARYREAMPGLPVMSRARPGTIRALLPRSAPEEGGPLDALLPLLDTAVLPGITHWNHPRFFAYFPSKTHLASVLADLVAAGLGAQGMSWQTSPAATEVEEVMMEWLRQLVGLPAEFRGVIHDTASTATLVALLCARERSSDNAQERGGLQTPHPPLVVYASEMANSSVEKAALLAGFGRDHLRLLPTDDAHALLPGALATAIEEDLAAGRKPCAVVATTGSTSTTAFDPLGDIAALARRHRLWLHVDAAMAGTAMACPELRSLWNGIEAADSLVFNPHKWMGVGFDCSAYFVRDVGFLVTVMSTHPSYLRTAADAEVVNFRDWGIPLGRRFRALKVWFVLQALGAEGVRTQVRRDLALARWLAGAVDSTPGWERRAPVPLQTVCLRHLLPGRTAAEVDAHNLRLAEAVNSSGEAYVTPAVVKGVQLIRVSIGSLDTTQEDVEAVWRLLRTYAERVQ
ncbi:MAG TPA: pyridoxal-dependent decarboxylase [Myxococcaceae bacterium]|nr:pyridoxal-dependent decarboxylase [Myxococcaceae bacterium]